MGIDRIQEFPDSLFPGCFPAAVLQPGP